MDRRILNNYIGTVIPGLIVELIQEKLKGDE